MFLAFISFLFLQEPYSHEQMLPVETTSFEMVVAWSPNALEIGIGSQSNLYIVDATSGEVVRKFGLEQFVGCGGPGYIRILIGIRMQQDLLSDEKMKK